jgi:hypothetical protein
MIEMQFPPVFRSLHQAFGTLVWLSVVSLTILSARAAKAIPASSEMRTAA